MSEILSYPNGTKRRSLAPWLLDEVQFYPYQIDGVRALANRASFILGDDMGLGKSLTAIALFAVDVKRNMAEKMLIICPVTLRGNWANEFEKFTNIPVMQLIGNPMERQTKLELFRDSVGPRALIMNYELVTKHVTMLNAIRFDVMCLDEAHYIKNPTSIRTRACHAVRVPRTFLLTGTPLLNRVNELWSLFHRLDPYRWPRYWSFVSRYAVFGGYKDKEIIGVKNENELREYLSQVMLRRLAKDVLSLKEPHRITRWVNLHPEQERIYADAEDNTLLSEISGEAYDLDNALALFTRLKQICATTLDFTGKDDSAILDQATEDVAEITANGGKVVIFTQFRTALAAAEKRVSALGVPVYTLHGDVPQEQREPTVEKWRKDKKPAVLICMLQVAREGLNMVEAKYGLFLDRLFVPGLNEQAVRRLNRIGQDSTTPITIISYKARNTIVSRIDEILEVKQRTSDLLIEGAANWKSAVRTAIQEAASRRTPAAGAKAVSAKSKGA